jgi:hypothetical protein
MSPVASMLVLVRIRAGIDSLFEIFCIGCIFVVVLHWFLFVIYVLVVNCFTGYWIYLTFLYWMYLPVLAACWERWRAPTNRIESRVIIMKGHSLIFDGRLICKIP